MPEIKQDIRVATLVVAANDSLNKNMADYVCDGVNDHIEIQAALDALPATGGEVKLLDGTFNVEVMITLDSNQTLRGCGRNTILTTATANLRFLRAVGISGTEKTGIIIADLQIDGATIATFGIYFEYVDYSFIQNVYSRRNDEGIYLESSDNNTITGNTCQGNTYGIDLYLANNNIIADNTCQGNTYGIDLYLSNNNNIVGNTCQGNTYGIVLYTSNNNAISGNTCQGNTEHGIYLRNTSNNNTVTGNICQGNTLDGIYLDSSHYNAISGNTCQGNGVNGMDLGSSDNNIIAGNTCIGNSQTTDLNSDNIVLFACDYNLIIGNLCRDGGGANQPAYGIDIGNATCDKNIVEGNDLYDSGKTANFNDAGTLTQVEDDNRGIEITQIKMYRTLKNTSGGQLVAGNVVILKAVAAGNEFTTTTTLGDDKVYGMVAETIADNASGLVLVKGKTIVLKVSGETDIAIGDLLGTHDSAGIAQKAGAGEQAFAIALEAYTTDDHSGVIDAYIKSPWD